MELKPQDIRRVFATMGRVLAWSWKNPHIILGTWIAVWGVVLSYVALTGGLGMALTLGVGGVMNMTSVMGFAVPLFALFIMLSQEIVPMIWSAIERAAYRLFRKAIQEIKEAINKIRQLAERIWEKIQQLFERVRKFVEGGMGMKKLLGETLQDIHRDLAEMDRLSPETRDMTDSLRQQTNAIVMDALWVGEHPEHLGNTSFVEDYENNISTTFTRLVQASTEKNL